MAGKEEHFGVGRFIGCSVCHLHVLVGNRTVVPPKTQNMSKLFNEKSENPIALDRAWSHDSNESKNHKSGIMAGRKGHFSVGRFIGYLVCHLHVLVGNRTVVPQKHKISQNCSMKNPKTHVLWIEHGQVWRVHTRKLRASKVADRCSFCNGKQ